MTLRTLARLVLVGSVTAAGLVASGAPASADFHLMKVEEVYAGTSSEPNADFVELEMQAPGQGNVSEHPLQLFDASGVRFECPVPVDVPNENTGDKILFATMQAETELGINADFSIPPMLNGASGAACFASVDCVSWGSFTATTPSPAGAPFPSGIPADQSIERGGPDTNNSQDDFSAMTPDAVPNVSDLGSMTCQPFTGGGPGGSAFSLSNLKTKVKGDRAIVSGKVQPPAPGQQVKLTFFANGSPLRKVSTKSATLNAASEFKKRFKVPADSTRCKVVVRFQGAKLGQKKFRC